MKFGLSRSRLILTLLTGVLLAMSPLTANAVALAADPSPSPTSTLGTPDGADGPKTKNDEGRDSDPPKYTAQVGVTKTHDVEDGTLAPGEEFIYTLTVQCSGLTTGCVGQTVTDVLPGDLDVTSLPQTTATRTVTFEEQTRTLTIEFTEALQEPQGAFGLNDGATRAIDIGMRLPADTDLDEGDPISNTATTIADNAPEDSSTTDLKVTIPRNVKPVVTKKWADGSAVAGSGEESLITLGIRNSSSKSVTVDELIVTDTDVDTFENFDLTSVEVTRWPAGADRAQLLVCTVASSDCDEDDYSAGAVLNALGALSLPAGTDVADVTGFKVRFFNSDGTALPYDATGGTVEAGLVLRDTVRSTGADLRPTARKTVENTAVPTAVEDSGDKTKGASASAKYDILPDTIVLGSTKSFFADTNGNFTKNSGEFAVVGENSPVSSTVTVTNNSAFALSEIRIVEPAAGSAAEFDKFDATDVRLRFPEGASEGKITVTYADGSTAPFSLTKNGTVDVKKTGTRPVGIEVVYTGVDDDGQPTIKIGAAAGLDLHGTLNDKVTADDLPGGTSPGIDNVASFEAKAITSNGTGTASGTVAGKLGVEVKRLTGNGVKSIATGQQTVPEGQPVPFTLRLNNNGNVALNNPVLTDPKVDQDDVPVATGNPFAVLKIVSATVRKDAGVGEVALTVFDPDAEGWVAYNANDAALLERATGIRAAVVGSLDPTKNVYVDLVTERRAGVDDGVEISNCFVFAADGLATSDPVCSPSVETGPVSSIASINKSISPGELAEQIPGVGQQTAVMALTIANTGNLNAKRLVLTDVDEDFFDAVNFGRVRSVAFPTGANRVQIDALTASGWHEGTPIGSQTNYPLPSGVAPVDVIGLRMTFTNSNGGYEIRPCEGTPTPTSCTGRIELDIHPRETLRSDATKSIPDELENTLTGGFETRIQTPGTVQPIAPTEATLKFIPGAAELDVDKTPNTAIAPGEIAPFRLTVTNSGTANLPNLVVKDLLPAGLRFDETFSGDDGQPFQIVDAQVPAGTDPVPTPKFSISRDGDRVSGLTWEFGDWTFRPGATFVIEIQVRLAPGVEEGQEHVNTMGATSAHPDMKCAPGTGNESSGAFGEGLYCTDTAVVRTRAGAAFEASKWVAGNDELGWYNNRTKSHVDVGDESCASLTQDGRTYTAFPCIALVNPGDEFDYLIEMVNAGTESATDMRIIDRFPVEGDKGVVLSGLDRGTEWDNRPTLSSAPVLHGSGTLTTTYEDSEPLCTDDLLMGDNCGAGTWDDPFGPDVAGMQMRVNWDTPLKPGEGVTLGFSMKTPLEVAQKSDPTIAWNSFGHAETTIRANGGSRVLPPTEPIQVGVATAYGSLKVEKEIGDNPADLDLSDKVYEFAYECEITPRGGTTQTVASGDLAFIAGESATVSGIPAGAECEVWETETHGGVTSHPADDPAVVTIDPRLGKDPAPASVVTVKNSYPEAELNIEKIVTGDAASFGTDATYEVEVLCTYGGVNVAGFPQTVKVTGNDTSSVKAPVGAVCTATETETGGATKNQVSPESITITPGASDTFGIEVTNTFEAGSLRIEKRLTGAGSELPDGPFVFTTECTFEGRDIGPFTTTLERDGDKTELSAVVDALLPVGASCTVTETDSGGADSTPEPVTVKIAKNDDDNTVQATFVNEFSAGMVSVAKDLAGDGAEKSYATDAIFTIDVFCAVDAAEDLVYSGSVEIKGGTTADITDADGNVVKVPLGSHCWGQESATGGATSVDINADSFDNALIVEDGTPDDLQTLAVKVTNTFDLTKLQLNKIVDGPAGSFAKDREFTLAVTCVLPQNGVDTVLFAEREVAITTDGPVMIDDLPIGAECWVAETDTRGATAVAIDHPDQSNPAIATESTANVKVTNTFDARELTVTKKVEGSLSGPFRFAMACTTPEGDVDLGDAAEFTLDAGESRTFTLPLGADCAVEEIDVREGVVVTYADSDGADDGKVVLTADQNVTVTNTAPGGLPKTGGSSHEWLLAALMLLFAGAMLFYGTGMRPNGRHAA